MLVPINDGNDDKQDTIPEFWEEDERRYLKDIQRIESSNMNFAERKYYCTLCESLYTCTTYYNRYESAAELLWSRSKKQKRIEL